MNKQLEVMRDNKACVIITDNSFKVHGVQLNRETDCLVFRDLIMEVYGYPTKRVVLSLIARTFDPLGLF